MLVFWIDERTKELDRENRLCLFGYTMLIKVASLPKSDLKKADLCSHLACNFSPLKAYRYLVPSVHVLSRQ